MKRKAVIRNIIFAACLLLVQNLITGQTPATRPTFEMLKERAKACFQYNNSSDHSPGEQENDGPQMQYERWLWHTGKCLLPDGTVADPIQDFKTYKDLHDYPFRNTDAIWESAGPTQLGSQYDGIGRIETIAFHPTDPEIFYVGTWGGGIWKTSDAGEHWVPLGDELPLCSVSSIAVDFVNPQVIYIAAGLNHTGLPGLGIFKSTDGGLSWNSVSPPSIDVDFTRYNKVIIHPGDHNTVFSCQSDGLWRSNDAGLNWAKINTQEFQDLQFNPLNSNTVYSSFGAYASGNPQIFKSLDGATTFSPITSFSGEIFLQFALTSADTNFIAVKTTYLSTIHLYTSSDGGASFQLKPAFSSTGGGEICISPADTNQLYTGFPFLYNSTDAGVSWNYFNAANLHADTRFLSTNPIDPGIIYICNDGGLYTYNEVSNVLKNLSSGLDITMYYDIAVSQLDAVMLVGGSQDNGSKYKNSLGQWQVLNYADGMFSYINPEHEQTQYTSTQHGALYRTYDAWVHQNPIWPTINPVYGAFVTPYMLDPNDPQTLFAGYEDVYKSVNEGDDWTIISDLASFGFDSKLHFLEVASANSNVIYVGNMYYDDFYYTNNGGDSWDVLNVPGSGTQTYSTIKTHPFDANKIYLVKDGYEANSKIMMSPDQGVTWVNISYNLPNAPALSLLIDKFSDPANLDMYIGTAVGVFHKRELDESWEYLGIGLPNSWVTDLEIRRDFHKLVAATYGHGIWELDISCVNGPTSVKDVNVEGAVSLVSTLVKNEELVFDLSFDKNISLAFTVYDLSGKSISDHQYTYRVGEKTHAFGIPALPDGAYIVKVSGEDFFKSFKFLKEGR